MTPFTSLNCPLLLYAYSQEDRLIQEEPEMTVWHSRPVLKQPLRLMGPDAYKSLDGQCLQRTKSLADATHPARHFTWTVDVVWLHVLCKLVLQRVQKSQCNVFTVKLMQHKTVFADHLHVVIMNTSSTI